MGKITYNKLVRDKIPQIIIREGKKVNYRTLGDDEYLLQLTRKLQEEAAELAAKDSNFAEELADLSELIEAITKANTIPRSKISSLKKSKKASHGGFNQRIFLESVED